VQYPTGSGDFLGSLADLFPAFCVQFVALCDKSVKLAFLFQFDFEFGDVEVFGVAEFPKQDRVDQLGNPLRDFASVPLLGDLEQDDLGWNSCGDRINQVGHLRTVDLLFEQGSVVLPHYFIVLQSIAEVLRKGAFTGAKEARDPDAHAVVRISRGLGDGLQQGGVLLLDAVRGNVLGDL
jgi:hypothetical protein